MRHRDFDLRRAIDLLVVVVAAVEAVQKIRFP
jgi:hypothetical protein